MSAVKTTANKNLGEAIRQGAAFRRIKERRAADVANRAAQLSPRGTGRTARSFVVSKSGQVVRVGNTDPFFHLTEWGSVNNPPYAPLRRGVNAAGLRLVERIK